jgi:hypothetical protein
MNYWQAEVMIGLTNAERQRELDALRLQNDFSTPRANWTFVTRTALKLSDWLIVTGENLRRHYEKNTPASTWADSRKFAR